MVGDSEVLVEITDISLERGEMRVLSPVSYICFTANTTFIKSTEDGGYDLRATPFLPSPSRNHFTVIGCNTLGLIGGYKGNVSHYVTGCYSYCESIDSTSDGAPCAGLGCCEAAIPTDLTTFGVMFEMNQSKVWSFNPCFYAMVSEVGWYSFQQKDLVGHLGFIDDRAQREAPVVADWAIRNGSCPEEGKDIPGDYACISANSYCMDANNGPGYLCQCSKGYEGNPYLLNGLKKCFDLLPLSCSHDGWSWSLKTSPEVAMLGAGESASSPSHAAGASRLRRLFLALPIQTASRHQSRPGLRRSPPPPRRRVPPPEAPQEPCPRLRQRKIFISELMPNFGVHTLIVWDIQESVSIGVWKISSNAATMQEASVLLMLIVLHAMAMSTTTSEPAISLPGCPDKCGNVSIPYPFGIGVGCSATSLSSYFTITCNNTFQPPRPMVRDLLLEREVIDISLEHGEVRIYGPVSYICFSSNTTIPENHTTGFTLEGTPFVPSTTRNRFMAIGCHTLGIIGGYMHSNSNLYVAGCYSYCQGINSTSNGAPCTGMGCCETTIIPDLTDFAAILVMNQSAVWDFNPCFYAMLVEAGWYSFRQQDLVGHLRFVNGRANRGVPVIHDWAIRNSSCPEGKKVPRDYAWLLFGGRCTDVGV